MYPYGDIRKVPLDYEGITSSAFAVQRCSKVENGINTWKECGVVSQKYMLVPNNDVRDLAGQIATESKLDWKFTKEFFDGRRFMYFMRCDSEKVNIAKDDDIALGIGFWNSYDGSTSLQFRTFLIRLTCLNGMITKDFMNLVKFKHDKTSEGYEDQIIKAAKVVDNCGPNVEEVAKRMRTMTKTECDIDLLSQIRCDLLNHIPVTLWGKISSKFLSEMYQTEDAATLWDFYNASTNVLWHEEKPTVSTFEHNSSITDSLLKYVA